MLAAESVYSVQPVKPFLMGCYACTTVAPVRRSQCAPYAHQRPFPKEIFLQMSPVVARLPDVDPVSHCRPRFYSFETTLASDPRLRVCWLRTVSAWNASSFWQAFPEMPLTVCPRQRPWGSALRSPGPQWSRKSARGAHAIGTPSIR
jgi:hypothetical protein